ncbi:hypothetical protein D3C81_1941680 [compost metagenome]
MVDVVGEDKAVEHFSGAGFEHGQGNVLDQAASAQRAIGTTSLSVQVVPVVYLWPYAPSASTERAKSVVMKTVDIDFTT